MEKVIGFNDLEVGKRVKAKGKPGESGTFLALEIATKTPSDQAEIEGLIQSINHQQNTLHILNREIAVPNSIEVKDVNSNSVGFKNLKAGNMVKLKGKYSEAKGFVVEKIKIKETMGFTIEELQGNIDKIDREKKTLQVVGFTVVVNEKTTIEWF